MLTMREKQSLSATLTRCYQKARKKEKVLILDEFVATTGYNRSYARHLLGTLKKRGRKKSYSPRKRIYDAEIFYPLRKIWIAGDFWPGRP